MIWINWISEIINQLPQILSYIVPGYIRELHIEITDESIFVGICIVLSIISSALLSVIVSSRTYNKLLRRLNISRTTNKNIWDDVYQDGTALKIYQENGSFYARHLKFCEKNQRELLVVLSRYGLFDKENNILIDKTEDNSEEIMLNTKDFKKIEIKHFKK